MKIGVFWVYLRESFAQFNGAAEQHKYRKLKCVHRIYGRYVVASITVNDAAVILLIGYGRASGARCVYVFQMSSRRAYQTTCNLTIIVLKRASLTL